MTTSSPNRECEHDEFEVVRPGPWVDYARTLRARRRKCDQPARPTDFETFRVLVDEWRNDTWYKSSIARRIANPAYLKIIGLGKQAIPWILQELRQEPDYWFAALEAITRDPHPPDAPTLHELRDAWLAWGEKNGY